MKLDSFVVDEVAQKSGKWIDLDEKSAILVARADNPDAVAMRKKLMAPYERPGFRQRKLPDAKGDEITIKVTAHAILRGWRGEVADLSSARMRAILAKHKIELSEYNPVQYTPEIGMAVLTEVKDFLSEVLGAAVTEAEYRVNDMEDDAGK